MEEASQRILALRGKPVIVLLYVNWSTRTRGLFPEIVQFLRRCQATGAALVAFSTDDDPEGLIQLPAFLRKHNAPFPPVALYEWPTGALSKAMSVHGIRIGPTWMAPLIAVLGRDGQAIAQAQGITRLETTLDLGEVGAACSEDASSLPVLSPPSRRQPA